jgi:biopolymer transport protein ExbB
MTRYSTSKFRLILLGVMLVAAMLVLSPSVFAQAATGGATDQTNTDPQSLFQLIWGHTDPVFFTIAALSIAGLTLIIQGFMQNRMSVFMPEATTQRIRDMIANRQFRELIEFTETDPSFVSRALNPALKRAPSFSAMKEAMETAIGEQTAEQFRKIEYLNIIGNLGPLLGLLGTVLGMIEAFSAMQAKHGSANPADLAGGISTALTHTFLGLFLAVPCLAAFGVLRTLVDRLTIRGSLVAEELLLMVKPADRGPAVPSNTLRPGAIPQPAAMPQTPSNLSGTMSGAPAIRKSAPTA